MYLRDLFKLKFKIHVVRKKLEKCWCQFSNKYNFNVKSYQLC